MCFKMSKIQLKVFYINLKVHKNVLKNLLNIIVHIKLNFLLNKYFFLIKIIAFFIYYLKILKEFEEILKLDVFEGYPKVYDRKIVQIKVKNDKYIDAWIYIAQ